MPFKELTSLAKKLSLDNVDVSKAILIRSVQDALDSLVSGQSCDNLDDKTVFLDTISTIPFYCRYVVKLNATGNRNWCYDIRDLWDCIVNKIAQPPYSRFRFEDIVPSDIYISTLTYKQHIQNRYRWLFEIFTEEAMERERPEISHWNKILSLLESESDIAVIQQRFADDTNIRFLKKDKIDNHRIFEKVIEHLATDTEMYVGLIKDFFRNGFLKPTSSSDTDDINTLTEAVLDQGHFSLAEWMIEHDAFLKDFLVNEDALVNAINDNNAAVAQWLIEEIRFGEMEGEISEDIILEAMRSSSDIFELLENMGFVNWHDIVELAPQDFVAYWDGTGRPIDDFDLNMTDLVHLIGGATEDISEQQIREVYDYLSPESYYKLHESLLRQGRYDQFLEWMDIIPDTIPRLDVLNILDIVLTPTYIEYERSKSSFIRHLLEKQEVFLDQLGSKINQPMQMKILAYDSKLLDGLFMDASNLMLIKLYFYIKEKRYDDVLTIMHQMKMHI